MVLLPLVVAPSNRDAFPAGGGAGLLRRKRAHIVRRNKTVRLMGKNAKRAFAQGVTAFLVLWMGALQ